MLIGIDHIVLAVDDPDATAAALEAEIGLTSGGGGRHEALGTFNRLVWLGDSYLELIGVFDRDLASRGWLGPSVLAALERGGGLATWAIAVDDLESQLRWAPDGGLAGPIDGERRRDGGRAAVGTGDRDDHAVGNAGCREDGDGSGHGGGHEVAGVVGDHEEADRGAGSQACKDEEN